MQASIYRLRTQDILTLCVLGLLFLGVVMVQSAAVNVTGQVGWHWTERGTRHVLFAVIALVAFFAVGHVDYAHLARRHGWRNPVLWMLGVAALACVLVLIPGVGHEVNGARRWLPLGFTQVQPSELGKWGIVIFLAWWLSARPMDLARFKGFIITLAPVGVVCLLIVIEDFGTAALIGLFAVAMCLAGRIKLWHLGLFVPVGAAGAAAFVLQPGKEYRVKRLLAFLDPFASPQGDGYHMVQSILSFASGGIFGRGLGRGIQKLGYLPEDTTDFIFAVICEELGVFGAMLTICLYLGILYVAWQAIRQKKDSFGQLLAFGVGSMIGLQALINIAVATVSVPPKGLSLPLISAGGSGLVITSAALGLLYSACRHQHDDEEVALPLQPKGFDVLPANAAVAA